MNAVIDKSVATTTAGTKGRMVSSTDNKSMVKSVDPRKKRKKSGELSDEDKTVYASAFSKAYGNNDVPTSVTVINSVESEYSEGYWF